MIIILIVCLRGIVSLCRPVDIKLRGKALSFLWGAFLIFFPWLCIVVIVIIDIIVVFLFFGGLGPI